MLTPSVQLPEQYDLDMAKQQQKRQAQDMAHHFPQQQIPLVAPPPSILKFPPYLL